MKPRQEILSFALFISAFITTSAFGADALEPATGKLDAEGATLFFDVRPLGIEGQGWTDVESPFDRLPAKAKSIVRQPVWEKSRQSAGMCVQFSTDSPRLVGRWTLSDTELAMLNMPASGVSGLDLYVKREGRWRWLAMARPEQGKTSTVTLVSDLPIERRDYLLYLPLYNGVTSVEIGISRDRTLIKPDPRPAGKQRPIVFYGTSITQGACASRPGMCHTAMLGRQLDRPVINLGFAANGNMDLEVASLLAELDPALYVIDCLPNMDGPAIAERAQPFVRTLRKAHPTTPILLVEDRTYPSGFLVESLRYHNTNSRAELRKAYDALIASGDKNLAYLNGDQLLADGGDDTVDGSHPTDLGFVHQADTMRPMMEKLLSAKP